MPDFDLATWESQVCQYPATGSRGVSYFYGDVSEHYGPGAHVDTLLWRDSDRTLRGILNRYPQDFPPHEVAGNVNVWVDPDWQRKGIGTALLTEADKRWGPLPYEQFNYTRAGLALVESFTKGGPP